MFYFRDNIQFLLALLLSRAFAFCDVNQGNSWLKHFDDITYCDYVNIFIGKHCIVPKIIEQLHIKSKIISSFLRAYIQYQPFRFYSIMRLQINGSFLSILFWSLHF